jgi:peptide subunit release factor RF-3
MADEYGTEVILTPEPYTLVRWLDATPVSPGRFGKLVHDLDGTPAVLFRHAREVDYFQEEHPRLGVRGLPE